MKKQLLLFLLIIINYTCLGQPPTLPYKTAGNAVYVDNSLNIPDSLKVKIYLGSLGSVDVVTKPQMIVPAFKVSSIPVIGEIVNRGTPDYIFRQLFGKSQPPTAALTGGIVQEILPSGGVLTATLNWTAGRQVATEPILSISISGFSQTVNPSFTQPTQGSSTSGSVTMSYPRNTTTTFTNTVTTISPDSKVAFSTTSFSFLPARYWGRSSLLDPTSSIIVSTAGGTKQLNNSKANLSGFTVTSSGSNYIYYAYPASLGDLSSIFVGGFSSFDTFTKKVISVTSTTGAIEDYNVYISKETYSATTPLIIVQ